MAREHIKQATAKSPSSIFSLIEPEKVPGMKTGQRSVAYQVGDWLEVAVQDKRVQVSPVGPHDGAKLVVYADRAKNSGSASGSNTGPRSSSVKST